MIEAVGRQWEDRLRGGFIILRITEVDERLSVVYHDDHEGIDHVFTFSNGMANSLEETPFDLIESRSTSALDEKLKKWNEDYQDLLISYGQLCYAMRFIDEVIISECNMADKVSLLCAIGEIQKIASDPKYFKEKYKNTDEKCIWGCHLK
jgi:hypothetical protein